MKIALCISGQPRFFKSSFKYLENFILKDFDCDIFICTCDFKIPIEKHGHYKYADEGTLDEFIKLYRPKAHIVDIIDEKVEETIKAQELKYAKSPNYREDNFLRRYLPMLKGIRDCNELRKKYQQDNHITYDTIIRTRSDVVYGKKFKDIYQLEKDLYVDIFGNDYGMEYYSNLFDHLDFYHNKVEINMQVLLDHHLQQNRINYSLVNAQLDIIKKSI